VARDQDWEGTLPLIPEVLAACVKQWGLVLGEPLEGGHMARVYSCRGPAGDALVLKLSPPKARPDLEAAALEHWGGKCAPRVRAFDAKRGALLMDRLVPGTLLPVGNAALAIETAASVAKAMHAHPTPEVDVFPDFEEWLPWYLEGTLGASEPDAVGTSMLDVLERCALSLDRTAPRRCLVHGDFLQKNFMLGAEGYVAADPRPHIADRCADLGLFASYYPPARKIARMARALAEAAGYDPDRCARWAAVWAIGEACETWRKDSDELQAWVAGPECRALLESC
jgi:streptomycin 6-kinase